MWVIHDPGSRTKGNNNKLKKALTTALKKKGDTSDNEIQGKVDAILSIIED